MSHPQGPPRHDAAAGPRPAAGSRGLPEGTGHGSALVFPRRGQVKGTAPNRATVMKEAAKEQRCLQDGNGRENHRPAGPALHSHNGRQRGGTHRLSPVRGPILPGMLSVGHEGAWDKGKGYSSGTAFPQDLHHREHTESGAPAVPRLMAAPELAAFRGTVMIPGNGEASPNLPMSVPNTCLSPGGCGSHWWFPSPAWACCCHPAGLPEGCAGTAVPSYRSPQIEGCGQDATMETRPCLGVARYLHGRN